MVTKDVTVGTNSVYGLNAVYSDAGYQNTLLALSFIDRSKVLSKAVVAAIADGGSVYINRRTYLTRNNQYYSCYKRINMGRDRFWLTTVLNKDIGKRYLITTEADLYGDLYNYLMLNYRLPLLQEWTQIIYDKIRGDRKISVMRNNYWTTWNTRELKDDAINLPGLQVHGKNIPVAQVVILDFAMLSEQCLQDSVTELIETGKIRVADTASEPLVVESFDSYIKNYGSTIVKNLETSFEPLSPLKGDLDGFAAKTKRLYPQQAACINGIIALKKANSQYGLMVEGMGCGKTLQGAAVVDAYFNQMWLNNHKGKDLKDLYISKDQPKYRNVLMAPSHLIEKWKEEITSEIPGSEVTILKDFDSLLELRHGGKERKGREWYLISKDFAKLGSYLSPIPSTVATMVPKAAVCKDCMEDSESPTIIYKDAKSKSCKRCGGRHFKFMEMHELGERTGLVCPKCGNLLIKPGVKADGSGNGDDEKKLVLTPADFASHGTTNDRCALCGESLWGVDCKPIGTSQDEDAKRRRWYKVTHYKNHQKKGKTTAFVLKGHEDDYLDREKREDFGAKKSPVEYGPRRYAPSMYIKKYLKGYFDFCVLDEAHKYESGASAQGIAAHALMKVSSFTLGLTGTITNGKADSLFYLLYMLDPRRMNKRGYKYNDVMNFVRAYGCIETTYEVNEETQYRAMSRGKQKGSPRIKPGISPLLFTDFLFDKAVFLDLSDLSSYLPPLKEEVVLCECPDDVFDGYGMVLNNLKTASREKGGRAVLSSMLQFGLAYPDKPYGFNPIMHPKFADTIISRVPSYDHYKTDYLLPKEEKLLEIVNREISQDRNCFIYCAYTGSEEMNITSRLLSLVEERCNLKGQVLVMQAQSPKATEREAYIRQKAAEGIRVFICNMKLVETGLDFCFKYQGADYNYPSIIFYQLTYELAVMWQASRRHYRLNQRQECHTYYMATSGTVQQAAVQIMAEKQVAASAIQGKFSADGLAAMAKGVDPRLKLAQMLADEDDGMDRESLSNMFDVMNASNSSGGDDSRYGDYVPPKTFYEVMDGEKAAFEVEKPVVVTKVTTVVNTSADESVTTETTTKTTVKKSVTKTKKKESYVDIAQMSIFDADSGFTFEALGSDLLDEQLKTTTSKKKPKKQIVGQFSLWDMLAA